MKNNSATKFLLVGKYYVNGVKSYDVLRASEDKSIIDSKFNSINVGSTKYSTIQVLSPKEVSV